MPVLLAKYGQIDANNIFINMNACIGISEMYTLCKALQQAGLGLIFDIPGLSFTKDKSGKYK